ncbi:MAG: hypothetical protein GKR94_07375 [Gammaproteobacteria bacterium]|nr:hypothetical protein [Gammaproteobacteria bacterium]
MKLLYTGNSPYARRARLAVYITGLIGRVEQVDISPRGDNLDQLLAHGPSAKVPLLVTDSGLGICESLIITQYLSALAGGALYPADPEALELELQVESIGSALMDSLFVRARENRREASIKSQEVIDLEAARASRCYEALERSVGQLDANRAGGIVTASSLGYADWRHPHDGWRDSCPGLAHWFADTSKIIVYAGTAPVF